MHATRTDTHRARFLDGMARAGSCVTVVTTDGSGGRHGVTVSAMASVSSEPPTLLVCINKVSRACAAVRDNGGFGVNLLAEDQLDLSELFAGRARHDVADRFALARWSRGDTSGAPLLDGALVGFDCRLYSVQDASSHLIFIGRVEQTRLRDGSPLVYCNRRYHRLVGLDAVAA